MEVEHARLLRGGWHLCADGCYRKVAIAPAQAEQS